MHVRSGKARTIAVTSFADSTLDYDRLRDSLASAGDVIAPAELHGGVCAALCGGGTPAAERWLADCLDDDSERIEVTSDLQDLVETSWTMLTDDALSFEPLLPSGEAPLAERVQALALWCQGFLAGLGQAAPRVALERGDDATDLREICNDLAEISRAGLSEDEAEHEDRADFSLAEIHEHVRVSVQLVFERLAAHREAAAREIH
jgi:uncharacterized protein YgfB (UPF0149 family)